MSQRRPPGGASARRIGLAVFAFTTVYFTGLFPPSKNPNELSRLQAIVAFVDHGTFSIDALLEKYGDHEDKAVFRGHFYSNKAPGLIFAGIAVYRAARFFAAEPTSATALPFILVRIVTVSLVSLLALSRLARRLAREPFRDEKGLVTLALALGTPFLFYGRSFFSHAWTGSLLFLAWDAVKSSEETRPVDGLAMLAGLLAGWAMISEYPVAPVVLLLGLRVFVGRRLPALARFCLGAAVPLALLLLYDAVCFGSPWSLSSAHEASALYSASARQGLFGIGLPSPRVLLGFLFGPSRGLILFSPFWLWAIPGFVAWWKSGESRRDWAFAAASVALSLVVLSGYPHWEGGFSLGSRYLVPVTFFAALGLPFALRSKLSRRLFVAAVAFSVAHFFLLTASWPHIPPTVRWPAANVAWWSLSRSWVAPNIGAQLGIAPPWSLLMPGLATLLALGTAASSRSRLLDRAEAAAAVVGIGTLALTIASAPGISPGDAAWRAWLFQYLRG